MVHLDSHIHDFEAVENATNARFRHVKEMIGIAVKRLHESRVQVEQASRLEYTSDFECCAPRVGQMFKNREAVDQLERSIAEWQPRVAVADIDARKVQHVEIDNVASKSVRARHARSKIERQSMRFRKHLLEHRAQPVRG